MTLLRALRGSAVLALVLVATALAPTATADAHPDGPAYAPVHRPGPALRVAKADLKAAMECSGNPRRGPRPVFLNPATSVTPDENYAWNWENVFAAQHRYWCTMTMPFHTFGDIQTAAEYIVFAIRTMHRRTDRKVAILGHSQGGMSGRWALRFWPDVRPMVSEVIGMAPSNHGTTALFQCVEGVTKCVPAVWQQAAGSAFIKALNSRAETFRGISYTNIYTAHDEVVTPPPSAGLSTGRGRIANVEVQDLCPLDPYEHVTMGTVSPAVYALVMDALQHRGPARVSRVDPAICTTLVMPGIDPADDLQDNLAPLLALPSLVSTSLPDVTFSGAPMLAREPRLRCYVYRAGC